MDQEKQTYECMNIPYRYTTVYTSNKYETVLWRSNLIFFRVRKEINVSFTTSSLLTKLLVDYSKENPAGSDICILIVTLFSWNKQNVLPNKRSRTEWIAAYYLPLCYCCLCAYPRKHFDTRKRRMRRRFPSKVASQLLRNHHGVLIKVARLRWLENWRVPLSQSSRNEAQSGGNNTWTRAIFFEPATLLWKQWERQVNTPSPGTWNTMFKSLRICTKRHL